ncbi:MAG: hypothetical protein KBD50_03870 [Candidatus Pacebacteria bacterium]|nr:hypothetical protein [Candidatus Paceibacterota bacterium]
MSFPSVAAVAAERDYDLNALTQDQAAEVLTEAVRRDCPEAVAYLHHLSHLAQRSEGEGVPWNEDPNSVLGKQLIRIHASDAVRPLVEKHFCHGERLTFVNCCGGKVGGQKPKDEDLLILQIHSQAGPIAYADC